MKKILIVIIIMSIVIGINEYYKYLNKSNNGVIDSVYTQNDKTDVYGMLKLESFNNKEYTAQDVIYVVIFDTGIQQAYAQSFYNSKNSCVNKILSYDNEKVYATESRHGTLLQQLFDEMSIRAGTINKIKTIHFKIKECDNEKIPKERIVSMLKEVLILKERGFNIKVLNISQVVNSDSTKDKEIQGMIETLYEEGIITVTSAGNIKKEKVKSNVFANSKKCIVVGGISLNNEIWESDGEGTPIDERINLYTYASDVRLGEKVPYFSEEVAGTSYSTVIVSWNIANYFAMYNDADVSYVNNRIRNSFTYINGVRILDINKMYKRGFKSD